MKNRVEFLQKAWYVDTKETIDFPENWEIDLFSPADLPGLNEEEIRSRLQSPINSGGLDSITGKTDNVLIICDDISRPTRTDLILPVLLDLLSERGVKKESISILISSGTHDLMNDYELGLKLGKKITEEYRIHLHRSNRGNKFIGKTSFGTPVYLNKLLLSHSQIIGVGSIVPHNPAGFGGGAKLLLGVCGIKSIMHFHHSRKGTLTGGDTANEFRLDILEAARMAGLNFIVNTLVNRKREVTNLFCGDLEEAFNQGVEISRKLFSVPHPDTSEYDLVIADVYPFDASFAFTRKGWWPVMNLSQECHKLIISAMPKGVGGHLIFPIPNNSKISKLQRLYYELISFGIRYFFKKSIGSRINKVGRKFRSKPKEFPGAKADKGKISRQRQEGGIPGIDVCYLHGAGGAEATSLQQLPYRLFCSTESYLKYIGELTGKKALRVAIYRASALTYPSKFSQEG